MSKPLSPVLTSYDFLKAAALVLMIVDHIGYFFYPDDMWWRAVGRMSAPVWLFLVGYARSRDVGARMWAGMAVLVVSNYVFGMPVLPLNILGTIIVCRLAIDPMMGFIRRHPSMLYPVLVLLFVGGVFTFMTVEYGTTAMMMVMTGYLVRNHEEMAMRKNDSDFRHAVNTGLMDAIASGLYFEIYDKWFGPKGEVPYPITAEIKRFLQMQVVPK